jgi:hypothetical protein
MKGDKMNDPPDEPPGSCCKHSDRHLGRDVHPASDRAAPNKGGTGEYGDRLPVILLNHLYRSGRVLYYPGDVGRGRGLLLYGRA